MRTIKTFAVAVLLLTVNILSAQSPSFKTYTNPVIPGDHPDCTLTQIGDDYYTTGSSFNVTPIIYHSTDLVHWEAIAQPVSSEWELYGDVPGGGIWGGHMVLYNDKYWHFFSRDNEMYFVTADQPEGPYTMPVHMNNPPELSYHLGYDNSIFIDEEAGTWYLVAKNGQPNGAIVELGDDGQPIKTYDLPWLNPEPELPYSWAEGPVMWKHEGYYYYSFARDLAGGQKIMRSTIISANESDWEMLGDFFDEDHPLKTTSKFTSPNHASPAVTLDDGTHWVIHPIYAKGEWRGQGRQGLLNQVRYDENLKPEGDYPINSYFEAPNLPSSGIPWMVPKSDFFNSEKLHPEWSYLGYTKHETVSLTERPSWLRLSPKSAAQWNTLLKKDGEHNYSLITKVDFDATAANDKAGLVIMRGDETQLVKMFSSVNQSGEKYVGFSFLDQEFRTPYTLGNEVWLRIIRINHVVYGFYSENGQDWMQVGNGFFLGEMDAFSDFVCYTGTHLGLFVEGKEAFFDMFIYRDAYSPFLAECPANWYGTQVSSPMNGVSMLDSINNQDWALYAGVEFGNDEYRMNVQSMQVVASSASQGGTIEVWADSINTGTLIASCEITNTGSWDTYRQFDAEVNDIKGNHDIYFYFKGEGAGNLFKIESFNFVSIPTPKLENALITEENKIKLVLTEEIAEPTDFNGFGIIKNGSEEATITEIGSDPDNSKILYITCENTFSNTDQVFMSYSSGSIESPSGLKLLSFQNTMINNALPGAAPVLQYTYAINQGDTLWVKSNLDLLAPEGAENDFVLNSNVRGEIEISKIELLDLDNEWLLIMPTEPVYFEEELTLSYSGESVISFNEGYLAEINNMQVYNYTVGFPVEFVKAEVLKSGTKYRTVSIEFDRELNEASVDLSNFSLTYNGTEVSIASLKVNANIVTFRLNPPVSFGDKIVLTYNGGDIKSLNGGALIAFDDVDIENPILEPNASIETNILNDANIKVFPNPASDRVYVESSAAFSAIEIINLSGQIVYSQQFENTMSKVSLPLSLVNGVYILKLRSDSYSKAKRIVVQH